MDNETVQSLSWLPGGERVWARRANVSSLTSYLQRPDFTNTLVDVMTSFRREPIALMSDIESMFHQVDVALDHWGAMSFFHLVRVG